MHLNQILLLHTLPGQIVPSAENPEGSDAWRLVQGRDLTRWSLRGSRAESTEYRSLDRLWNALGGVVEWSRWTPASQAAIEALGGRRWFVD